MQIFKRLILLVGLLVAGAGAEEPNLANAELKAKLIYLTPEPLPEQLFVGQVIEVTLSALIAEPNFEKIETVLTSSSGVKTLGKEPQWVQIDENRHRLTLFFQITDYQPVLPNVRVMLWVAGEIADEALWEGPSRSASRVANNPQYSGVLAESLGVVTHKVEKFNDMQNILVMELNGTYSNLEDFSLNGIETQGIDWVDTKLPTTRIFYYALIDPEQSSISFNYFKPSTGNFQRIALDFDLSNLGQRISTHVDINPKKRAFPWLDVLFLALASVLLVFFFFRTHRWIFLGMVALTVLLAFWLIIREESITIREGAEIRLLPTSTSTLFYVTYRPTEATVLKEKDGYVKVLLPDEKIGWVKRQEVLD